VPDDWVCAAGSTLLIPSGPLGKHLFVVLNDPTDFEDYPPQSCVSVCLCTIRNPPYDTTRIIGAGAHPFITSSSYISYRHARIDQAAHLESLVRNKQFSPLEPVSEDLLAQIRSGLHLSRQTPNYLKLILSP
jgi:hypothetical protein